MRDTRRCIRKVLLSASNLSHDAWWTAGAAGLPRGAVPLENRIQQVTCRIFRALGGADILVNHAVEDGFSADLPCADVGHGRGVNVGFIVGDALGDALMRPGRVVMRLVVGQDGTQGRRESARGPGSPGAGCRRGARRSRS